MVFFKNSTRYFLPKDWCRRNFYIFILLPVNLPRIAILFIRRREILSKLHLGLIPSFSRNHNIKKILRLQRETAPKWYFHADLRLYLISSVDVKTVNAFHVHQSRGSTCKYLTLTVDWVIGVNLVGVGVIRRAWTVFIPPGMHHSCLQRTTTCTCLLSNN